MKKLTLFLLITLVAVVSFTSCLEGDNTSTTYSVGVLDYSRNYTTPVMKTLSGDFYGPELNALITSGNMEVGECWYFQITYNSDLPENSPEMVEINGYYTVSIYPIAKADKYYAAPYLTDTSEVMTNELPVSEILYNNALVGYAEGYLFITHVVNHEADLRLDWNISYDSDDMITEENGVRNYNLFIRAVKSTTGDDGKSGTNQSHFNAYQLKDFLDKAARNERDEAGINATITIKFNYVSEIKESEIIWKSTTAGVPAALFVSD
ncbi:MAG: hypothetical protein LBG28_12100 [Tannerella sp.]|jgi:hypothetical protein|nr:hypothetical protein [Tannerella sp.]